MDTAETNIGALQINTVKYADGHSRELTLTDKGNWVKISGVADGEANTDAANIAQLNGVEKRVGSAAAAALGGTSSYSSGTLTAGLTLEDGGQNYTSVQDALRAVNSEAVDKGAWTLQANGGSNFTVGDGAVVNLANGDNVEITANNGTYTFSVAENPTFGAVTASRLSITSGGSGIAMNNTKITGLAAGDISSVQSTDAVTGGQLFATNQSIETLRDSVIMYDSGKTSITLSENGGNGTVIHNVGTPQSATDAANKKYVDDSITTISGSVGTLSDRAVVYDGSQGDAKAQITLADNNGAGTKLTNVADGELTADSTDAVTGSQLFATNQNLASLSAIAVQYDGTDKKSVSFNNGGDAVELKNVANPTGNLSAANKQYVDTEIGNVNTSVGALSDRAVVYDGSQGDAKTQITLADNNGAGTKLTNVADGEVRQGGKDAVNGGQLYALGTAAASALGGTTAYNGAANTLTVGLSRDFSGFGGTPGASGNSFGSVQDVIGSIDGQFASYGSFIASTIGSGAAFDGGTGALSISGTPFAGKSTIAGGFDALNGKIDALGNSLASTVIGNGTSYDSATGTMSGHAGITVETPDSSGGSQTPGNTVQSSVNSGGTLGFANGSNVEISQTTGADGSTTVTVGVSDNPEFDSVKVGDTVTVDKDGADMGGTKVTNMADGQVAAGSKEGVTGGELHNTGSSVANIFNKDGAGFTVGEDGTITGGFTANGQSGLTVQEALDSLSAGGGSVEYNEINLGDTINITEGGVTIEGDKTFNLGDTVHVTNEGIQLGDVVNITQEGAKFGNTVNITQNGIDMGNTNITNLAPGAIAPGSTDAVTGDQLWRAYNRMDDLGERINVVGAHAAALSGLHPIQYNPYEPTTLSAAVGTYRDEYAVAVGVFHYVRENMLFNVGASLCSDGDLMGRAGISIAVGKNTKRKPELARDMVGMQRQMYVMQAKLERLESENKQSEAAEAKLREENAQNRRIIEQNAETLRKNEEIMKKNAELIRELTKKLEAKK